MKWTVPTCQRALRNAIVLRDLPQYLDMKKQNQKLMGILDREESSRQAKEEEIRRRLLPSKLTFQTHNAFFRPLLHLEEWQQRIDLQRNVICSTTLAPERDHYSLCIPVWETEVPGVKVNGTLHVRKRDGDNVWHRATFNRARIPHTVALRFHDGSFECDPPHELVDVMFELDGTPWRRRHRANNLTRKAAHQRRLLFPDINYILGLRRLTDAEIDTIDLEEDNSLLSNREQKETIAKIVTEPPGSVPFIIFGPPGTGKTLTVAKAALQLLKRKPDVRLLMCAPTNEAADLLAYKMMELGPTQLFRLNAPGRPVDSDTKLRAALKDFSVTKDDKYGIPDLDRLQSYRVVVATCASAAIPYLLQIERGWFTHIFVDEASQCTEPDTMIPLKLLADQKTNIILAGDFKQLGPVIHSSLASDFGLKHSYMERLSDLPIYDLKDYGGVTIIKLLNHFRSHPAIIGFSNQHFYDNELKLCGDEAITHSMLDSDVLDGLNPKFPVVFHAVKGREVQKGHSPSYFNMPEAMLVSRYCEMLINDTNCPITAQEIGIISPYSAQCHKIRALLKQSPMDTDALRIGSTEQFQGQDYRVIIISTVRSNQKRADRDIRQRLGFVADPRRFNVATTRARSLLVVIGDPDVLALDDVWREFMVYVKANGGWRGKFVSGSYGNGCNAGFEGETGGEGAVDQ